MILSRVSISQKPDVIRALGERQPTVVSSPGQYLISAGMGDVSSTILFLLARLAWSRGRCAVWKAHVVDLALSLRRGRRQASVGLHYHYG